MIEKLEKWKKLIEKTDLQLSLLCDFLCANNSDLVQSFEQMQYEYTEIVSASIGDDDGWLMWFWHDNAMGNNNYAARVNGSEKTISNIQDLSLVIEMSKE